jgi:N-acetylmuramoyl-L-alanine amidase
MIRKVIIALMILASPAFADEKCISTEEEIENLALNIYHEARGESIDGMQMVGEVTLNRVASIRYPDNICDVIYQKSQFSWTHLIKDHTPHEDEAWETSLEIAEKLIREDVELFDNGATHYLNPDKVSKLPRWARKFKIVGKVGRHVFYRRGT